MRLEAAQPQKSRQLLMWASLLLTLALVYWQWSAGQDAADETVVADSSLTAPARVKNNVQSAAEPIAASTTEHAAPDHATPALVAELATPAAVTPAPVSNVVLPRLSPAKVSHALFTAHEWLPPPPKPQPPPPPKAPPLPYTYVGSLQDVPEGNTVILMQQKKVLMPRLKSQVTAQWRLDREDEQSVYFTYLPLNQVVVLSKAKTAAAGQRQAAVETEDNIPLEQ
ncbi:hypothetical protein [Methylophilus sp.]|uniref:hypothetical protein n=1 Tax=Methylophilus sp. TaxID=29541 RepID=UPI00403564A0